MRVFHTQVFEHWYRNVSLCRHSWSALLLFIIPFSLLFYLGYEIRSVFLITCLSLVSKFVSLSSAFSLSLNKSSISHPSSVRGLCICHSSDDRGICFVPFYSDEVWSKSVHFDDFVCAKVICLPRKAKSCVTKASLSSPLSIYILQWMLIITLRELSSRWLYIFPQLSHFYFSGFTDPNTFSSFARSRFINHVFGIFRITCPIFPC